MLWMKRGLQSIISPCSPVSRELEGLEPWWASRWVLWSLELEGDRLRSPESWLSMGSSGGAGLLTGWRRNSAYQFGTSVKGISSTEQNGRRSSGTFSRAVRHKWVADRQKGNFHDIEILWIAKPQAEALSPCDVAMLCQIDLDKSSPESYYEAIAAWAMLVVIFPFLVCNLWCNKWRPWGDQFLCLWDVKLYEYIPLQPRFEAVCLVGR